MIRSNRGGAPSAVCSPAAAGAASPTGRVPARPSASRRSELGRMGGFRVCRGEGLGLIIPEGFALPRESGPTLRIYDASGRLVRELARGVAGAGDHAVRWDG